MTRICGVCLKEFDDTFVEEMFNNTPRQMWVCKKCLQLIEEEYKND